MTRLCQTVLGAVLTTLWFVATHASAAETHEWAWYEVIVKRSPFGPVGGAGPETPASFAANYTLVGYVNSNDVAMTPLAIILNKQSNRTYFRAEGAMVDDVKVLQVERVGNTAKVILIKGIEKATLTFEQKPASASPVPSVAVPAQAQPPPGTPPPPRRVPFRRGSS